MPKGGISSPTTFTLMVLCPSANQRTRLYRGRLSRIGSAVPIETHMTQFQPHEINLNGNRQQIFIWLAHNTRARVHISIELKLSCICVVC